MIRGLAAMPLQDEKSGAGEGIRTLDPNLARLGLACFWNFRQVS
jgi:hypothetical protein